MNRCWKLIELLSYLRHFFIPCTLITARHSIIRAFYIIDRVITLVEKKATNPYNVSDRTFYRRIFAPSWSLFALIICYCQFGPRTRRAFNKLPDDEFSGRPTNHRAKRTPRPFLYFYLLWIFFFCWIFIFSCRFFAFAVGTRDRRPPIKIVLGPNAGKWYSRLPLSRQY